MKYLKSLSILLIMFFVCCQPGHKTIIKKDEPVSKEMDKLLSLTVAKKEVPTKKGPDKKPVRKEKKYKLLFMGLAEKKMKKAYIKSLEDKITSTLVRFRDKFFLVAQEEIEEYGSKSDYIKPGTIAIKKATKIAKKVEVDKIIVGSLIRLKKNKYQLTFKLVDVTSDPYIIENSLTGTIKSSKKITGVMRQMLKKLFD